MLYETKNSFKDELIKQEKNTDFSFPKHMHSSFEFITVYDGEMLVTVDNCEYILHI